MAGRLEGKIAVVTGASRGLGQYCAVAYAKEGAKVVIAARTEEQKDERLPGTIYETARLVAEAGSEALPVVCNVADYESVEAMIKTALDRYGRIDILMTNAAVQPPGGVSTIQIRHWELEFRVNVHGPFYCIRAALPSMIEQGSGNIINISSVAAARGGSPYGATKRAIESMTIGLANEVKDKGIAVNCLKPVGAIETPGVMFVYGGPGSGRRASSTMAPADSYVEAAVLLAMQTVQTKTGAVYTDAEALQALAEPGVYERFKALNPPVWSEPVQTFSTP
jgi:NAD(P)-dependent dehydrogenase (short-subunit alcohol dehydrogenase family)